MPTLTFAPKYPPLGSVQVEHRHCRLRHSAKSIARDYLNEQNFASCSKKRFASALACLCDCDDLHPIPPSNNIEDHWWKEMRRVPILGNYSQGPAANSSAAVHCKGARSTAGRLVGRARVRVSGDRDGIPFYRQADCCVGAGMGGWAAAGALVRHFEHVVVVGTRPIASGCCTPYWHPPIPTHARGPWRLA